MHEVSELRSTEPNRSDIKDGGHVYTLRLMCCRVIGLIHTTKKKKTIAFSSFGEKTTVTSSVCKK